MHMPSYCCSDNVETRQSQITLRSTALSLRECILIFSLCFLFCYFRSLTRSDQLKVILTIIHQRSLRQPPRVLHQWTSLKLCHMIKGKPKDNVWLKKGNREFCNKCQTCRKRLSERIRNFICQRKPSKYGMLSLEVQ